MDNEKHHCHLSIKALALTGALLWGVYLFFTALLSGLGITFMWVSAELVELLNTIYPGYVIGFGGAVVGLLYGLICGAVCGGLIAWLYNKFCGAR